MSSPVYILSLDGGGILGVSELLILKQIMSGIKPNHPDVRPRDVFDLIGGSGTGGLNAILLGRLGLTIDEALECYETISDRSFRFLGKHKSDKITSGLEEAVKDILGKHNLQESKMQDKTCTKTFVLAMKGDNLTANIPDFLRSYGVRSNQGPNPKIWEAIRATTASRPFMEDIRVKFGPMQSMRYVGTTLGNNNPVERALEEAKILFPQREIAMVLSIGAGQPGVIELSDGSRMIQKTLEEICKDCEEVHERLEKKFPSHEPTGINKKYWRINVEHGMGDVELRAHDAYLSEKNTDKINAHVTGYLDKLEMKNTINKVVEVLKAKVMPN